MSKYLLLLSELFLTNPKWEINMYMNIFFVCLFDSLRPLNNLSVMRDGLPGLNQY